MPERDPAQSVEASTDFGTILGAWQGTHELSVNFVTGAMSSRMYTCRAPHKLGLFTADSS